MFFFLVLLIEQLIVYFVAVHSSTINYPSIRRHGNIKVVHAFRTYSMVAAALSLTLQRLKKIKRC